MMIWTKKSLTCVLYSPRRRLETSRWRTPSRSTTWMRTGWSARTTSKPWWTDSCTTTTNTWQRPRRQLSSTASWGRWTTMRTGLSASQSFSKPCKNVQTLSPTSKCTFNPGFFSGTGERDFPETCLLYEFLESCSAIFPWVLTYLYPFIHARAKSAQWCATLRFIYKNNRLHFPDFTKQGLRTLHTT